MDKFYEYALSDSNLEGQKFRLIEKVCPYAPNENGCVKGVENWWDSIAQMLFTEEAARVVCFAMDQNCYAFK